jgi:hypothetical protein
MRLRYSRPVTSLDTAETACYSTGIRNIEAYFETDFVHAFRYQLGIADTMRFAPVQHYSTSRQGMT